MTHSARYTLYRETEDGEEEIKLWLDYHLTPYTPATRYAPAEGGEVEDLMAWDEAGKAIVLTDAEEDRALEHIYSLGEK